MSLCMDANNTLKPWLTLALCKGIGPAKASDLLSEFKNPESIFHADKEQLKRFGLHESLIENLRNPNHQKIDDCLIWLESAENHHLITLGDKDYPELLKEISDPPIVLFAVGQREILKTVSFAIVGSRNPTSTGKKNAQNFAAELARLGFTICSGLALGVDYHSHYGALNASAPTIAVLGNGLATIYPAKHKDIARKISETGLLVSEFSPYTKPLPGNFPRRNRIISGISVGVLVVEAANRSGSLITAHCAMEQGREVFAIPGSIHNPLAKGSHSLIKEGAKLVESVSDITDELASLVSFAFKDLEEKKQFPEPDFMHEPEHKKIWELIGYEEVTIDYLVTVSGLTSEVVSSILSLMEIQGIVESRHGGHYNRCN